MSQVHRPGHGDRVELVPVVARPPATRTLHPLHSLLLQRGGMKDCGKGLVYGNIVSWDTQGPSQGQLLTRILHADRQEGPGSVPRRVRLPHTVDTSLPHSGHIQPFY